MERNSTDRKILKKKQSDNVCDYFFGKGCSFCETGESTSKTGTEMKQEMISIASLMAGRVVAAAMNTEAQNRLIEETLKEIDESTWEL